MAGITFDDLTPQKKTVSFDDLYQEQVSPQGDAGSAARAVAYGLSGGQVPFGNVITSGIGAGIAKAASPITGDERTYRELYDQAQADTKATQEANPLATLGGNALGIVSTLPIGFTKSLSGQVPTQGARGALNAIPAGLSKVGDFVRGGAVAKPGAGQALLRGAKAGFVSALVAGLYGAGEADAGNRLQQGIESAGMGAAIGAALPVGGAVLGAAGKAAIGGTKNIITGIGARGEDAISETLSAIKDGSRRLYSAADDAGVLAKPDAVQPLLDNLSGVVKNKDIASQKLYSATLGAIKDLGDDIAAGNTGLMTLDRHRQILGNLAKDITNPNKSQEAEAAGRAIDFIDNFIEDLTPDKLLSGDVSAVQALTAARAEWAKSKRFEKIGQIIIGAANDANKLKRDLEKFRTNPKNTMGWSGEELEALKQASNQTTGEGVLKLLGKFGFDLGGGRAVGNTALPVIGGLASGVGAGAGVGALVPVIGTAARSGQKAIAAGKAENLLQVIEQGGKVTNQMINALPQAEKNNFLKQVMQMPVAKATGLFKKKIKSLPTSEYLNMPELPTKNLMDRFSKIESVPLSSVRAGQSKMAWDDFNKGIHPGALIKGYEDKPIAIKLRNGEYIIQDGHHRTIKEINKNKDVMDMYVIDAENYDPVNAGRKTIKASKEEIDNLLNELNQ